MRAFESCIRWGTPQSCLAALNAVHRARELAAMVVDTATELAPGLDSMPQHCVCSLCAHFASMEEF